MQIIRMEVGNAYYTPVAHGRGTILALVGEGPQGVVPSEMTITAEGVWEMEHPDHGLVRGISDTADAAMEDAAQDALGLDAERIARFRQQEELNLLRQAVAALQRDNKVLMQKAALPPMGDDLRQEALKRQVEQLRAALRDEREAHAKLLAGQTSLKPSEHLRPRTLGERLSEYHIRSGRTYVAISRELGVSEKTVRVWCAGASVPTGSRPALLEAFLARHANDWNQTEDLDIDELFGQEEAE